MPFDTVFFSVLSLINNQRGEWRVKDFWIQIHSVLNDPVLSTREKRMILAIEYQLTSSEIDQLVEEDGE